MEVQRLLEAARGGPPPLPDGVRLASATATARLGGGAPTSGWWSALKVVGALSAIGAAGFAVTHRRAPPADAPHPPTVLRPPSGPRPSTTPSPGLSPPVVTSAPPRSPTPPSVAPASAASARPPAAEGGDRGAEVALLEHARRLLSTGETALSLAALRDHARRFPHSALAEERDYLTFRARARDAPPAGVGREADWFLRRHPAGIYSSQVRSTRAAPQ